MFRACLFSVPLLVAGLTAPASAGEAKSDGVTLMPMPYAEAMRWYEKHRAPLFKASNAEIVESRGKGQYVLRTQTPLGACTYRVKETVETGDGKTVYRVKFIQSLTGAVSDQAMTVTLAAQGNSTQVTLSLYVNVDKRLAPSIAIKAVTDESIRQTVKYLKQHAR